MKPGTFNRPEEAARLRVRFRSIPVTSGQVFTFTVNAWRVTFYVNPRAGTIIDGVEWRTFFDGDDSLGPVCIPVEIGGAYQPNGEPLYVNQAVTIRARNEPGVLLVKEEYHEQQSRQNR